MDLGGIGKDHRFPGADICFNINCAWDGGTDKPQYLFEKGRDLEWQTAVVLFSAEGKDLLDQVSGTDSGLMDTGKKAGNFWIVFHLQLAEFGKADDCREDIVKVVGNAAGKGADGFHFLRLPQLGFHLLAVIDIYPGADKVPGAVNLHHGRGEKENFLGSILWLGSKFYRGGLDIIHPLLQPSD